MPTLPIRSRNLSRRLDHRLVGVVACSLSRQSKITEVEACSTLLQKGRERTFLPRLAINGNTRGAAVCARNLTNLLSHLPKSKGVEARLLEEVKIKRMKISRVKEGVDLAAKPEVPGTLLTP
jgi:hypothetical protein